MFPNPTSTKPPHNQTYERLLLVGSFLVTATVIWFVLYLIGCYIELLVLLGRSW